MRSLASLAGLLSVACSAGAPNNTVDVRPARFEPSGIVGETPILSWVTSIGSGIATVLPDDRWTLPYQWLEGESSAQVWRTGTAYSRPLQDNPVGLRAIRPENYWVVGGNRPGDSLWGFRDELILDPGTPAARSLGFIAPWFDEWSAVGYANQAALAAEMVAVGGEVDYLVIDWEWQNSVFTVQQHLGLLGETLADYITAVTQDPRWPALQAALNQAAVDAGYDPAVVNFDDDLAGFSTWNSGHSPHGWVWGRLMHSRIVEALEHILCDAWSEQFPGLSSSNYDNYVGGPWPQYAHGTWSVDSLSVPLHIGAATRWFPGTHQAPMGYGSRGLVFPTPIQIHLPATNDPPQLPLSKWNPPPAMDERFAVLIKTLRKLRGAVRHQDAAGDPPLQFWVCGDQYASCLWVPAGGAPDYQWYAETMFHFGLHGVSEWLVWNTPRLTDGSSEQRVSDVVDELDGFIGGIAGRRVLTVAPPDWDTDRYVASGVDIGDWHVYRFTPGEPGSVVSEDPFTFRFTADGAEVVPVAGGARYVVPATQSDVGAWIVVREGP